MHTNLASVSAGRWPSPRTLRRLGMISLAAALALTCFASAPAPAWGQFLYGRPVVQPCFDFPNWARFSNCRPGPLPWGYEVFPDYGPVDCNCGPDSVACDVDFVAHRPSTWYASADFAPLMMDYGSDIVVARVFVDEEAQPGFDTNGDGDLNDPGDILAQPPIPAHYGPIALTSDDLKPEFDSGGKFTIGRRIFDCYRIEATYLGNYHWESAAVARSVAADLSSILGGFPDPVNLGPDDVFDNNTEVSVAQATRMSSAELNLRYWVSMPPGPFDVSILVGARYMNLDDAFRIVTTNAGGVNDLSVATENTLWGVQIGIEGSALKTTRFWCDFDLKGGIYSNEATVFYDLDAADDTLDNALLGDANRTSFVGDISLVGHWQMTPWLVFNLGYQALFVDGVALGLTNVEIPGDDSGRIVFHGPTIGLMGVW